MTGKTIGKYRFVEELGHGALGTVYRAVDESLGRDVAIKVLHVDAGNSGLVEHFQTEAATLAALNHPDIVAFREFQRADADLLMIMEFVSGETLEQLASRCGPLPPERAAYLVAQLLGALEEAHKAGVFHRDLKPSNVMVTEQGSVKVTDFGMVRVATADQMTADGFTLATPSYMAPEQLVGREVDARADVYSAGVLFYRLLTGHVPFEARSPLDMVRKQLEDTATRAQKYRPDLPGWTQAILDRALARAPDDRFPTADSFRAALLAAISEATETTGIYPPVALPSAPPLTHITPDAVTAILSVPAAEPLTVPTRPSRHSTPPPSISPVPATFAPVETQVAPSSTLTGKTLVLKKNQFAAAGAVIAGLVVLLVVLAIIVLRRPATAVVTAPATSSTAAAPASEPAPAPVVVDTPPPAASTAAPAPVEISAPPLVLPPAAAAAPAPRPSPTTPLATAPIPARKMDPTPFRFEAKAVVADGDKRRERDVLVTLADGTVTVKEKDKTDKALYVVPLDTLVGLTYSNSKQPLWNSPEGPAEAMRVEGGAFGFLKGGERNWFGLRTRESLLVVRVDDDAVGRVSEGLQAHTGLTLERLKSPKD